MVILHYLWARVETRAVAIYVHFQLLTHEEKIVTVNQHANDMFIYNLDCFLTYVRILNIKV